MDQNARFLIILHCISQLTTESNSKYFLSYLFKRYLFPVNLAGTIRSCQGNIGEYQFIKLYYLYILKSFDKHSTLAKIKSHLRKDTGEADISDSNLPLSLPGGQSQDEISDDLRSSQMKVREVLIGRKRRL